MYMPAKLSLLAKAILLPTDSLEWEGLFLWILGNGLQVPVMFYTFMQMATWAYMRVKYYQAVYFRCFYFTCVIML